MQLSRHLLLTLGLVLGACEAPPPAEEEQVDDPLTGRDVIVQRKLTQPNALLNGAWHDPVNANDTPTMTTPDGRLSIMLDIGAGPAWTVRATRAPQATAYNATRGTVDPAFVDDMLSPISATIGGDPGPWSRTVNGKTDAPNHHLGVAHDPRMPGGVTALRVADTSACLDPRVLPEQLTFDPAGTWECRRLVVVQGSFGVPRHGLIAVASEVWAARAARDRLREPRALRAVFMRPFEPMTSSVGAFLPAIIEVSVTADARLFYGSGYYAMNERPWLASGWDNRSRLELAQPSKHPADLCLYSTSSEAACSATDTRRVHFALKFPVAAYPFRNADGSLYTGDGRSFGLRYTWISFDGTEIFGNLSEAGGVVGHARGARGMIGKGTRGRFKYLDTTANVTRGYWCIDPVTGQPYAQVDGEPTEPGRCREYDGLRTTAPLGTATGLWRAFPEQAEAVLPWVRRRPSYLLLEAHNMLRNFGGTAASAFNTHSTARSATAVGRRVYHEVAMDDFVDGDYLAYYHMNELVRANSDRVRIFDLTGTPDTSGNDCTLRHGASAARFSFERNGTDVPGDVNDGFMGRALTFGSGALMRSTCAPLATLAGTMTVELAVKPAALPTARHSLLSNGTAWAVALESARELSLTVGSATVRWPVSLSAGTWTHFTVVVQPAATGGSTARLYQDGEVQAELALSTTVAGANALCVGPGCASSAASTTLAIDEIAISRVARDAAHAAVAALALAESSAFTPGRSEAEGSYLFRGDGVWPTWSTVLRPAELRIPDALLDFVRWSGTTEHSGAVRRTRFERLRALGEALFRDDVLTTYRTGTTYLEAANGRSCASCHQGDSGARTGVRFDQGVRRGVATTQPLLINTPNSDNRAFSTRQFLDVRSPDVLEQVLHPMTGSFVSPNDGLEYFEMGGDLTRVLGFLNSADAGRVVAGVTPADGFPRAGDGFPSGVTAPRGVPNYLAWFRFVFGTSASDTSVRVTEARLRLALAAFLVGRVGALSPAELVLSDQANSLSNAEQAQVRRGRLLFEGKARCTACHSGAMLSDELVHVSGPSGVATKTPSLRGLARTAPYFRGGESRDSTLATCPIGAAAGSLDEELCRVVSFYNAGAHRTTTAGVTVTSDQELFPLGLSTAEIQDLVVYLKNL